MATAEREIVVEVKVCSRDHGGPSNAATVYGHYEPDKRTCIRIGQSGAWVHTPKRVKKGKW